MFIIIGEYQRQKKEYTSVNKKKEKSICENIIYETTNTHTHTQMNYHTQKTNKKRTLTWYCNSASLIRINALLLLDVVVGTTLVVDTAVAVAVLVRGVAYDCCCCGWDWDLDDDDDDGVPAKSENDIFSFPY